MEIKEAPCWIDSIKNFLQTKELSEDPIKAKNIKRKGAKFIVHEGKLLLKSVTKTDMNSFLQCLMPIEAKLALLEMHKGMCGNHIGARTMVHKARSQGYYCPTMI